MENKESSVEEERGCSGGKAAEEFIILLPHIGFIHWEAIYTEPAAVAAHHADLISFEDVFCDLHVVQLWKFTQMNGKRQSVAHAAGNLHNWNSLQKKKKTE